jgi:hypothetical protein
METLTLMAYPRQFMSTDTIARTELMCEDTTAVPPEQIRQSIEVLHVGGDHD